ncbi:hypothetical protein BB559_003763 [Furculomyces boomerangus]|uniref:Cullin family profile domain-containing protein n=2 Tax=Harpellales TaxID=61421 RepID=A0A2T9YIV3_9FUNG|nr:hypothetical protein BB559_003763 [Furculomyces boomerangus]PWA00650.1 hypothetical protein BB558_003296 [Smittium angustum]
MNNSNRGFEEVSTFLKDGINQILQRVDEGVSYDRYMNLYTGASLTNTIGAGSHKGAHILGGQLYSKLWEQVKDHNTKLLKNISAYDGKLLLKKYEEEWKKYVLASSILRQVFSYVNRHWVKREHDEGRLVKDIYSLMISEWNDSVFTGINEKLIIAANSEIENWRNNEIVETTPIKTLTDSCIVLGSVNTKSDYSEIYTYKKYFEEPVEPILIAEESRIEKILHNSSFTPVMQAAEKVLIQDHLQNYEAEFVSFLENYVVDDLYLIFRLLSRIPNGLVGSQSLFQEFVNSTGLSAIEKIPLDKDDNVDPTLYVEKLIEVHDVYSHLTKVSFLNNPGFTMALDRAFKEFVNKNSVCKGSTSKPSEILNRHCDSLLKKGAKIADESQLETRLNQSITILRYIEDRDAFQDLYRRSLSRRLVNEQSVSFDAEKSMIAKLKELCGFDFTNKLTRMFNDIEINQELNSSYRELDSSQSNIDFSSKILNTAAWPLSAPKHNFNLPHDLSKIVDSYTGFYTKRHQGRKLNWLWQYSKADLKLTLKQKPSGAPITYIFTVSTFQYAILSLFNTAEDGIVSYASVSQTTGLPSNVIDAAFSIFTKSKLILIVDSTGSPIEDKKVTPESFFKLNTGFKSKKLKMNLNMPLKADQKKEAIEASKAIREDRRIVIQAAIVRIMKTKKSLKHSLLVNETISQLISRFKPSVPDIKRAIDALIDMEYIERASGTTDTYNYLA